MIQKGNSVYIVPKDPRKSPYWAKVKSIGPKYITTDGHSSYSRFDIITHESVNDKMGWNPQQKLYKSKAEYDDEMLEIERRKFLLTKIEKSLSSLSIKQLEQICNIL